MGHRVGHNWELTLSLFVFFTLTPFFMNRASVSKAHSLAPQALWPWLFRSLKCAGGVRVALPKVAGPASGCCSCVAAAALKRAKGPQMDNHPVKTAWWRKGFEKRNGSTSRAVLFTWTVGGSCLQAIVKGSLCTETPLQGTPFIHAYMHTHTHPPGMETISHTHTHRHTHKHQVHWIYSVSDQGFQAVIPNLPLTISVILNKSVFLPGVYFLHQ